MARTKASILAVIITAMTSAVLLCLPFTPKVKVQTMRAERGEVIRTARMSGVVGYRQQQFCVSLQDGLVKSVHVSPGQRVSKGDVLFRMDTSAQEASLAQLYGMQNELFLKQGFLLEQEAALLLSIENASIRAAMDGIVDAVYIEENGFVGAMTLLGSIRGEEKCITAAGQVAGLVPGAAGEAGKMGAVRLASVTAPDAEMAGMQQFIFAPVSQEQLSKCRIGEKVTVEAVLETVENCVPIPLSAVDSHNRVWYMQDGRAMVERIDPAVYSREAVAAPLSWEGRSIILYPDEEILHEGCAVREAKRK